MLAIVDVFSSNAWCYPMHTKSLEDTTPAMREFVKSSGIHEFNKPRCASSRVTVFSVLSHQLEPGVILFSFKIEWLIFHI